MSSTSHTITITGKDGTKQMFDAIKHGATEDAAALQKMGAAANTGFKQVESSAKTAGSSVDGLNKRMAALGAALSTGAAVLGEWSRNSQDAQAIQRQLEASITATGESYEKYADQVEEAGRRAVQLGMDDEAASQAISALTQITGNASAAIDQMGLVMDLAAAKHMTLENSAELIGKVMSGNTGILARYGVVVEKGATSTEALAQIQEQVAGQAEASATSYGRLREQMSNVTDSIGGAVGQFAPLLAMLPGVSVGFSAIGSAVGALAPNLTKAGAASAALNLALGPVGIAAGAAAAGLAIFELVKRADDATLSVKEAAQQVKDFDEALAGLGKSGTPKEALKGLADMREILVQLALDSEHASQAQEAADLKLANAREAQLNAQMGGTEAQKESANAALAAAEEYSKTIEGTILNEKQMASVATDFKEIWTDQNPLNFDLVVAQLDHLKFQLDNNVISADEYVSAVHKLNQESDSYGLSIEEIVSGQRQQAGSTRDLTATINELTAAQDRQASAQTRQSANMAAAEAARMEDFRRGAELQEAIQEKTSANMAAAEEARIHDFERGAERQAAAQEQASANIVGAEQDIQDAFVNAQDRQASYQEGFTANIEAQKAALEELKKTITETAAALDTTGSFASQLRPVDLTPKGGDKATGTAANLQMVGSALDSVLGTFKELDSLGQAAEQAGSIAENLIGDPGELGQIDRLLKQGRISETAYNNAVQAGNDIRKEAGAIENDLNTIRAKQLPLLAEADQAYGNVIDKISHMGAEEARATLGFMDVNEAMKAQNALALVASASMGELGAKGKQATTDLLQGAVDADPVLRSMLETMGLITTIDAEGHIKVNFENGKEVKADLDDVVTAIDQLAIAIDMMDGVADLDITIKAQGADETSEKLRGIKHDAEDIPDEHNTDITETGSDSTRSAMTGTTIDVSNIPDSHNTDVTQTGAEATQGAAQATTEMVNNIPFFHGVDIQAYDNASGPINSVASALAGLNGMTATTYINTIVTTFTQQIALGGGQAAGPGGAHGLLVGPEKGMAGGGMTVRVNEGGQERVQLPTGDDVWLPSGSMVTPHAASMYGRKGNQSRGREFVNYGSITILANNPAEFSTWADSYATAGR
jgi:hypothetical protein